ncbi:MAG: HD domain-containing protein [bacterium]|nr:MAG: HD domain-containing protein [bacterium]
MPDKKHIKLGRDLLPWERAVLDACDLYLVGGTVRDQLLGIRAESLDRDYLATRITMDDLVPILERFGKPSLVGKSFGVIKFYSPEGEQIDISLPRTEHSTGPGHRDFDVRYDPTLPVEKDLERRDFTINSMALHLGSLHLVDPLHGEQDLKSRTLRINHEESFREDPLRIIRGVQFIARFDLEVDDETLRIMHRDKDLLISVSPERIREELNKMMLLAKCPGDGYLFMHEHGILPLILPELEAAFGVEQNEFHPDDLFTHSTKSCNEAEPTLHLRWSALLHDLGKKDTKQEVKGRIVFYRHENVSAEITRNVLNRLRFPNEFVSRVEHLVRHHMFLITDEWSDSAVRRFIARVGRENVDDLLLLRRADAISRGDREVDANVSYIRERIERVTTAEAAFKREDLAINGADVIRTLGIEPGPEVGRILSALLEYVLEDPSLNESEKLLELAREIHSES